MRRQARAIAEKPQHNRRQAPPEKVPEEVPEQRGESMALQAKAQGSMRPPASAGESGAQPGMQPGGIRLPVMRPAMQRRAMSPIIQRKEIDKMPVSPYDWTAMDRGYQNKRWQRACLLNLIKGNNDAYTQPHERRDFYLWLYNYTSGLGYETRWPIAAYMVASGAAQLSYGTMFDNDTQIAARQGNQIIFDDVFPKLKALVTGGVLKGKKAMDWDMKILSEEQELVQHMYKGMSKATIKDFEGYAKGTHPSAVAGSTVFGYPQTKGRHHRYLKMPWFTGNIMNVDDRFQYGMKLANYYSKHPGHKGKPTRPAAGAAYTSGTAFTKHNNRIGLHRLDAELDDFDVTESKVITLMKALSPDEQKLMGDNIKRLEFITDSLSSSELESAIRHMPHLPATVKKWLRNNV